jgi:hypothetical protein
VVSEYGSTIADRPGRYEPGWGDLPNTPGAAPNQAGSWRLPWRSGESIWCAFDHGSIAGRDFGAMGLVDYFRLPKRQWYWYRNEYRHIPPPAWPGSGVPIALKLKADQPSLKSADGTDDAQIVVSVVDRNGATLTNCPPVTLAVESGPGEFPTGPSITFAPDSDITIRDGMAAIEFRSYFAGETTIRATSPGLQSDSIQIATLAGPKFIPGQTPPVKSRPYVRFTGAGKDGLPVVWGQDNPTLASSEAPDHAAILANDNNPATYWQAASGDSNAWWRVDLERLVNVNFVRLSFPSDGNWRYRVDVSNDGIHDWRLLADESQTTNNRRDRTDSVPHGSIRGRYLRVTIFSAPPGQAPGLSEVRAMGTL